MRGRGPGMLGVLSVLAVVVMLTAGASQAFSEGARLDPSEGGDEEPSAREAGNTTEIEQGESRRPASTKEPTTVTSPPPADADSLVPGEELHKEGRVPMGSPYIFHVGASQIPTPYVVSVDVVAFPGSRDADSAGGVISFLRASSRAYVRERPSADATIFGVIPEDVSFAVIGAPFEGEGCRGGMWHQVELGGYTCLRGSRSATQRPKTFPSMRKNKFSPLFFVRARRTRDGEEEPVFPRYHSRWRMERDEVEDYLAGYGTYGFVRLKRGVFTDIEGRTVRNQDFRRFSPSNFEGVVPAQVTAAGVPDGQTLAWTFEPETFVYRDNGRWARKLRELRKHASILVPAGPPEVVAGRSWLRLEDGWIRADEVRRWERVSPPEGMTASQKWIDVDLDEQILTMYEGADPVFVTLVTTGRGGESRTPVGTYEIGRKKGIGDMKSRQGVRRPYFVGDVPWIQFFHEGFALHSTYWHNKFGKKGSHGCVNMSLKDAARLFAWTTPEVPAGWNWRFLRESERGRGTTIVLRSATRQREASEDEAQRAGPVAPVSPAGLVDPGPTP